LAIDPTRFDPGFEGALLTLEERFGAAGLRLPGRNSLVQREVDLSVDLWRKSQVLAGNSEAGN